MFDRESRCAQAVNKPNTVREDVRQRELTLTSLFSATPSVRLLDAHILEGETPLTYRRLRPSTEGKFKLSGST